MMPPVTMLFRRQRGAATPFVLLLVAAGIGLAAFATDGARVKSDAAQLKRATDAAAVAVSQAHARNPAADVQDMAERYIQVNLGMDATQVSDALSVSLEQVTSGDAKGYRVSASFRVRQWLLGGSDETVQVSSAAVARYSPLELALVEPVDLAMSAGDISDMKELTKDFIDRLYDNTTSATTYDQEKNIWVSLVPYSQAVNVYDATDTDRIRRWARPGALAPVELRSLFASGYSDLADRRIPDRRANLLCLYRGLRAGEAYFWDQQPAGQFGIYYRADLVENGSPGAPPISWIGPNPMFGQATGVNDTRWMVADRGCPNAALLPLSADRDKLFARIDEMAPRFNVNYAIALGWAGVSLSPAMRGAAGWGDEKLPLDFNGDNSQPNQKVIVMVAKLSGNWIDTDAYNFEITESAGDGIAASTQRFIDLCRQYQTRKLRFFLLGVRPGDPKDPGNTNFGKQAMPGLTLCAGDDGKIDFFDGADIATVKSQLATRFNEIADELKRDISYVRLIE